MVATAHSSHPTTFAIFYETTPGTPPANAAAWAAAEGSTADRLAVIDTDPGNVRQAAVVDPNMVDRTFGKNAPIKGLRNAEGIPLVVKLTGTGATTDAGNQVSETALLRLLGHMMGGKWRGNSTVLDATVTSNVDYEVVASTNLEVGGFVTVEDTDDANRPFPQRILTKSGDAITLDYATPIGTIATSDVIQGVAAAYIDDQALMNPSDGSASTVSCLWQKANGLWQLAGGRIQLDSIEFPRGDVPRLNCTIMGSYAQPYGDGAPTAPTWTGSVQGESGLAIGADTKCFIEDKGTTTNTLIDVISAKVTPGIPVQPLDTITEITDNMQGRGGYGTKPADTIIEVQAFLDTGWQDDWDNGQAKVLRLFQVGPAGTGWFVHASECYLMDPPAYGSANEAGVQTLRFICHEDRSLDSTAGNLDLARSKVIVGQF